MANQLHKNITDTDLHAVERQHPSNPNGSLVGIVGQYAQDTSTGDVYRCTGGTGWQKIIDVSVSTGGAAGSNTQVQYNDAGSTAGATGLVYNKATSTTTATNLSVTGSTTIGDAPSDSFTAKAKQLTIASGISQESDRARIVLTTYDDAAIDGADITIITPITGDDKTITLPAATGTLSYFTATGTNNEIITSGGDYGLVSESNLTFDGSTLAVTGAITANTLNTGHGANELYPMDQPVRTSDSPEFVALTLSQASGIAPMTITSNTVVTNLNADLWDGYQFADYINQPIRTGDTPSFTRLTLSQATGTAPLTITSTTLVSNLNADLWDGYQFADYLNQAVKTTSSPSFYGLTIGQGTVGSQSSQINLKTYDNDLGTTVNFILKSPSGIVTTGADRTLTLPNETGILLTTTGDGSGLTNVDAETLDGFDSTQFLRSDDTDTATGSLRFENDLNYFGKAVTANEAEIVVNTGNAGSPQIGFTEHGDASWAIGVDDGDNSFKIHGAANATIPTINNLATPLFELLTTGAVYLNGNRVLTTADEGAGNGIDADTLDGFDSSYFLNYDNITTGTPPAGGAAGSDGQVQYNNSGALAGASALYYDDTNGRLGINNTSPQTGLDINGNIRITGRSAVPTSGAGMELFYYSTNDSFYMEAYDYSTSAYKTIRFGASSFLFNNGNVGIGTTPSASYKLDVNGSQIIRGDLTINKGSAGSPQYIYNENGGSDLIIYTNSGRVQIDDDFTVTQGAVFNEDGGNYDFRVEGDTNQNLLFVDASTDRVGIGTATPSAKLHSISTDGGDYSFSASGNTKAVRITHNSTLTAIQGVDNTLSASYQPLSIGGSYTVIETGGGERMRIDSSGNVGIGTGATVSYKLTVKASSSGYLMSALNTSGNLIGAFYQTGGGAGQLYLYDSSGNENVKLSTIDNSYFNGGNVGIGTGATVSAKLHVNGGVYIGDGNNSIRFRTSSNWDYYLNATNDDFRIYDSQSTNFFEAVYNGGSTNKYARILNTLFVKNDGNVGIGTGATVSAKLHIQGGNATFGTPGAGVNTNGRFISIEGNADAGGEGSGRIFFAEHNATTAAMDNYGMSIGYRGGNTSIVGASGNTWTGLSLINNGEWGMWGHGNNATGSLIMRGDRDASYVSFPNANVGIGGTPTHKLYIRNDVAASTDLDPTAIKLYNNSDGGSAIEFSNGVSGNSKISFGVESTGAGTDDTFLAFSTGQNTALTERMRITSGGNVGIGVISPNAPLEIAAGGTNGTLSVGRVSGYPNIKASTDGSGHLMMDSRSNYASINHYVSYNVLLAFGGGNVGIGTASPNAKIDVRGSAIFNEDGGNNDFRVESDTDQYALFMDASASCVGISTGAPNASYSFHVGGGNALIENNLDVVGTLSKGGGSFRIPHPDPAKPTMELWHSFTESPTAGENLYRWQVEVKGGIGTILLPDYYKHLNENDQVWVSPYKHFGQAWGEVTEDQEYLIIHANEDGLYNVLLIGTRKDEIAKKAWKGAEREGNLDYIRASKNYNSKQQ